MFATTFLGHQGWVFQSGRSCVLVDPLLSEEFGQAHALSYRVFPPRIFHLDAFPKVDAVVLTHEHDDHFDIPSLAKLDRRIPIFLSARSSTAGFKILAAMGFQVTPMVPGVDFSCGDLQVLPLAGDHQNSKSGDEWDTLPFLIRQADGHGSFFSMVDCSLTSAHIALARTFVTRPGLVGWTNNAQDWSHMIDCVAERTEETAQFAHGLGEGYTALSQRWGVPGAMILCAGGFSFYGARKWLNRRVFCVDSERVVKLAAAKYPNQRFLVGRPGQTLYMEGNVVKRVEKQAPFLQTAPPNTWPLREKTPMTEFPDYEPATGRLTLTADELAELGPRLNEFAGVLLGGRMFKNLYSLLDIEGGGRMGTFVFVLRQGDGIAPLVYMYNPSACSFELTPVDSPRQVFIGGMECWAADLLAVLRGEIGVIALLFGRALCWNALPRRLNFDVFSELFRMSHPLRRPAEYLRIYERLLHSCGPVTPSIMHRTA